MAHVDALRRSFTENISILSANITEDVTNRSLMQAHNDYCFRDGRLYKITNTGPKWVIPKSAQWTILVYYHDAAGHFAVDWFPSMRAYIKNYYIKW